MAGHVRAYKSITERWRQADAQDLLTSQSSEMGELQVPWETLPQNRKTEVGDNRRRCLL